MSQGTVTPISKGFEFSYKAFENVGNFVNGVRKVYNCETLPSVKSTYRIKRLCDAVQQELKHYSEMAQKIPKDVTDKERDEKLKEIRDEVTVQLKWAPLSKEELESIQGVSAADLTALEHITSPDVFEG